MFTHVLVPLDGSTLAECVLPHVVAFGLAFDAQITLLRILPPASESEQARPIDRISWSAGRSEAEAYLADVAKRLEPSNLEISQVVLEGKPAEQIVEYAHSHDAKLLVLSSHGRGGLSRWNVSGEAQKMLNEIGQSTLLIRAFYADPTADPLSLRYQRILALMDGSRRAEAALAPAGILAQAHDSQLILAHVVARPALPRMVPPTPEDLDLVARLVECNEQAACEYLQELQQRLQVDVATRQIVSDDVLDSLHELADGENADLVVVTAHGYSGKSRWPYGSVANSFMQYGGAPLLIVQDLAPAEVLPAKAALAAQQQTGH